MQKPVFSLLSTLILATGVWQTGASPARSAIRLPAQDLPAQDLPAQNLPVLSPPDTEPTAIELLPGRAMPTLLAGRFNRRYRFGVRASRYRRGGFARGDCPNPESFVPLVPDFAVESDADADSAPPLVQNRLAPAYLSAAGHPVFFVNMPEIPATQGTLFVDMADPDVSRNQRQLYRVDFELSGGPGVVGIRIPDNAPQLVPGESYLWRLSIACTPGSFRDIVRLRGGVLTQVEAAPGTPDEQTQVYLEQLVWQDLLNTVAEARYQNPGALEAETDWQEFVESSGLEAMVDVPIVEFVDARFVE